MGDYTAFHIQFKLKPNTPKKIVQYFDLLYLVDADEMSDEDYGEKLTKLQEEINIDFFKGDISRSLHLHVAGHSSYHDGWCVTEKTADGLYRSFASTKRSDPEMLVRIFLRMFDYLDVKDGDILARYVEEHGPVDRIIFIDHGQRAICEGYGISYNCTHGYAEDYRHPSRSKEGKGIYIPIMNRNELLVLSLIASPKPIEITTLYESSAVDITSLPRLEQDGALRNSIEAANHISQESRLNVSNAIQRASDLAKNYDEAGLAALFKGAEDSGFFSVHFHNSGSFSDKHENDRGISVVVPGGHFAFAFVTTPPLRRDSTEEQSNGSLWPSVLDPLLKGFPFEEGNDRRKKTKNKPVPYYLKFSGAFGSKR